MVTVDAETTEKVRQYISGALGTKRYEHSVRVAETAGHICSLFGMDYSSGYFAGLSHDLCKEFDEATLRSLVKRSKFSVSVSEERTVSLLHGKAAAVKLEEDFGISDADILQAVAEHTLGNENLCPLARIVFVADKIEPGRPQSTESYREGLYALGLNGMCLSVVEENMEYLRNHGKEIAVESYKFLEDLRRIVAAEKGIA